MAGPRARLGQALASEERPAAHDRERHLWMELEAIGLPIAEGLRLEILPPSQQGRSVWQIKTFPVPLVHVVRESAIAEAMPMFRRMDGVIADFHTSLRVRTDPVAKMASEHLGAKTNAKKGRVFFKREPDPVYFLAQPGIIVVDAHRTAEDNHAGIASERFRQWIAETGTPAVKFTSLCAQQLPQPPRSRMLLMQDNEYPAVKVRACCCHSQYLRDQAGRQQVGARFCCNREITAKTTDFGKNGKNKTVSLFKSPGTISRRPAISPA
jgi:hypothetical protein